MLTFNHQSDNKTIRLVETVGWNDGCPGDDYQYVTLSHCWGPPKMAEKQIKLRSSNIEDFKRGLSLDDLPKTFRQAMEFAAKIPKVGYIWIDSLCIKQGDVEDWLKESAAMGQVYSYTFLNISATAGTDSTFGLFSRR
ncbi:hypothetical protein BU23DRAFT_461996, partial [Bimuria novae-zelandiae CBS 107.79]